MLIFEYEMILLGKWGIMECMHDKDHGLIRVIM